MLRNKQHIEFIIMSWVAAAKLQFQGQFGSSSSNGAQWQHAQGKQKCLCLGLAGVSMLLLEQSCGIIFLMLLSVIKGWYSSIP